jgi:hypothetical protein
VSSALRDLEAAHVLLLLDAPGVGPRKCLQLLHRHGPNFDTWSLMVAEKE